MRVRIIGGGVAGLSLALALQERAGIDEVLIYERETSETLPQKLGHGLILMANGVEALAAIGSEDVLEGSQPLRRTMIQDERGALLHDKAMGEVFSVTRAAIVDGLRQRLGAGILKLSRRCVAVHTETTTAGRRRVCALSFAGGEREEILADELVVDASGWRSPLCTALNPDFARRPSRVKELVTSTHMPEIAAQLGDSFVKTMVPGRGTAFGLLAPTSDRVIGFLQFDADSIQAPPRGANEEPLRAFLREQVADAPALVQEYIDRADLSTAHVWHPVDADLPPHIHCDNAVLIGDAAHPLLPFTSQGVSAALEDSVILADSLATIERADELATVLAGFAADRREDVSVYIEEGRQILRDFVSPEQPAVLPFIDSAASKLGEHLALPAARITDLFAALDVDDNGYLDLDEYSRALTCIDLGGDADAYAYDTFSELDLDHNGGLDLDELRTGLRGEARYASSGLLRLRERLSPRRIGALMAMMEPARVGSQSTIGAGNVR